MRTLLLVLVAACRPWGEPDSKTVQPGEAAVFVGWRTVVWVPPETEAAVEITLTVERGEGSVETTDRFGIERTLTLAERLYRVEIDGELNNPVWIGRWDTKSVRGELAEVFTVAETEDGWEAQGLYEAPLVEMDEVLLTPDRSWFPTRADVLHGSAGR